MNNFTFFNVRNTFSEKYLITVQGTLTLFKLQKLFYRSETVHVGKNINRFIPGNGNLLEPVVTFVSLNPINFSQLLLCWRVLSFAIERQIFFYLHFGITFYTITTTATTFLWAVILHFHDYLPDWIVHFFFYFFFGTSFRHLQ